MDEYRIERTLLTNGEMQDILAGLRSLDSINGTNRYGQLMEKLSVGLSDFMEGNQVKALFETECKLRLVKEFGISSFVEQEDVIDRTKRN